MSALPIATPTKTPHTGDLSRRVSHRQAGLGLSTEELAERAGMNVGYLEYLKHSPAAEMSISATLRLANALDTTARALVGGEVDRPPGGGRAGLHPSLETLSQDECRAHLSAGGVGRIVFSTATGPVALPVNFVSPNADVIFRTVESVATAVELEETVSFEVDRIDDAMSEGWSVLATGNPYRVENPQERHELEILDVEPWAGGVRNVFMWIASETLSGRVIVQQADPESEQASGA